MKLNSLPFIFLVSLFCYSCSEVSDKNTENNGVISGDSGCSDSLVKITLTDTFSIKNIIDKLEKTDSIRNNRFRFNFEYSSKHINYCINTYIIIPPDLEKRPVGWMIDNESYYVILDSKNNRYHFDENFISLNQVNPSVKQSINQFNKLYFMSGYNTEKFGLVIKSIFDWMHQSISKKSLDTLKYKNNIYDFELYFVMPDSVMINYK